MSRNSKDEAKITTMSDPSDDFVIRCTIDKVLAARGITSRRQAWRHIPGIGKNTIQTLADGTVKGVDFKTLLRICVSLRCSFNDLFEIVAKEDVGNEENASTTP